MSFFLATSVSILTLIAPFFVILAVTTAIGMGIVLVLVGLRGGKPLHAVKGTLVLAVAVSIGITLLNWSATKPVEGDASSAHVLVYTTWQQTLQRIGTMKKK